MKILSLLHSLRSLVLGLFPAQFSSNPKPQTIVPATAISTTTCALLPSFLTAAPKPKAASHGGISALDGLRGIACLFVVNEHLTYNFTTVFLASPGDGRSYYPIQLPFIRIAWSGQSMVRVFFVISGYVLTYKPFRQLHQRDFSGARSTLTSSTFRRAMRLYLPTWTAILTCATLSWLGAYNKAADVWRTEGNVFNLHEGPPLHFDSLYDQWSDAIYYALRMLNVFTLEAGELSAEHYDAHTWTIPVEYKCSIILFAAILAFSQVKPLFRMLCLFLTCAIAVYSRAQFVFLFLAGAVLADMDHHIRDVLRQYENLEHGPDSSLTKRFIINYLYPKSKVFLYIFGFGIYLLCCPLSGWREDIFYGSYIDYLPFQGCFGLDEWMRVYGALLVVWAVANSTLLAPLFTNSFATYLGKVSFALYLVHGDILRCVLFAAAPTIYSITGDGTYTNATPWGLFWSWCIAAILTLPIIFWIADLFWRFVDEPWTRFARRVEMWMRDDDGEKSPLLS